MALPQQDPGFDLEGLVRNLVQIGVVIAFFGLPILRSIVESRKKDASTKSRPRPAQRPAPRRAPRPELENEPIPVTWDELVRQAHGEASPPPAPAVPKRVPVEKPKHAAPAAPTSAPLIVEAVGGLTSRQFESFDSPIGLADSGETVELLGAHESEPLASFASVQVSRAIGRSKRRRSIRGRGWRDAIILREVLDRPVSMRDPGGANQAS